VNVKVVWLIFYLTQKVYLHKIQFVTAPSVIDVL